MLLIGSLSRLGGYSPLTGSKYSLAKWCEKNDLMKICLSWPLSFSLLQGETQKTEIPHLYQSPLKSD